MSRLAYALFLLPLAGCAKSGATPIAATGGTGQPGVIERAPTADGLQLEKVDLNGDGKVEIINYYRERTDAPRLLVRKEMDFNRDGRIDVRSTFDDAGLRVQEDMDGDFDGRPDWVDHYIGGKRTWTEVDTDFNGTFDLFKYYENGKVRRKERDTDADGRPDFWEYLDESGNVVKTGRDLDKDGKMDVRDQ